MWKALLYSTMVTALALEKPFDLTGWDINGDAHPGIDVIRVGTAPGLAGSIWSKDTVAFDEWTLEASVRTFKSVNDEAPGRSGVALWYTSEKLPKGPVHGSADAWDGLAVMLDSLGWDDYGQNGDLAGAVRGHINDGSNKFLSADQAPQQSFSLCRIDYRNSGASPIKIRAGYGKGVFVVDVNGQKCFWSDKIAFPSGYYVGFSADTETSGDTFAIDSLQVTQGLSAELAAHVPSNKLIGEGGAAPADHADHAAPAAPAAAAGGADQALLDTIARLEARLEDVQRQQREQELIVADQAARQVSFHEQYQNQQPVTDETLPRDIQLLRDNVNAVSQRLQRLENTVHELAAKGGKQDPAISAEIQSLHQKLGQIETSSEGHREAISQTLAASSIPAAGPSLLTVVLIVAAAQIVSYVAYNAYLTRKNRHQKLL